MLLVEDSRFYVGKTRHTSNQHWEGYLTCRVIQKVRQGGKVCATDPHRYRSEQ